MAFMILLANGCWSFALDGEGTLTTFATTISSSARIKSSIWKPTRVAAEISSSFVGVIIYASSLSSSDRSSGVAQNFPKEVLSMSFGEQKMLPGRFSEPTSCPKADGEAPGSGWGEAP
jgi:hypothetical protein